MEITLYNQAGEKHDKLEVSKKLFGVVPNNDLIWQVVTSQTANRRHVLAHTKSRAEVAGGGRKPWRQKGTGRARHGSIRSPIWVGGGVAHGPTKEAVFEKTIPRAQARKALAGTISARYAEGKLLAVDLLPIASGKTKDASKLITTLAEKITGYKKGGRILVVLGNNDDQMIIRALANLKWTDTVRAQELQALTVLAYPFMIATADAVRIMNEMVKR